MLTTTVSVHVLAPSWVGESCLSLGLLFFGRSISATRETKNISVGEFGKFKEEVVCGEIAMAVKISKTRMRPLAQNVPNAATLPRPRPSYQLFRP